ncbi:hypothetical protein P280DRAFT_474953 [Massarina eburnea CBS 473.64]|uniref:Uncharacterized protein n=1 Tax=Massarina eburnea CBS 473.64 TaxID=1395130 RepID=A0A6A6RGB2_9PLEO|nr:hypothetical protein P280DRAFT_474953 [Massarina eburnea CBS 473.64]
MPPGGAPRRRREPRQTILFQSRHPDTSGRCASALQTGPSTRCRPLPRTVLCTCTCTYGAARAALAGAWLTCSPPSTLFNLSGPRQGREGLSVLWRFGVLGDIEPINS